MSKYEIKIDGMHCNACKILITEELEEKGLRNVDVDLENGKVTFEDSDSITEVESTLKEAFANLDHYKLINVNQVNQ